MHNLCILVRVIDGGVDTIIYVPAVGISVAECDCVCTRCLGHDALSKILVLCRKGREVGSVNRGVHKHPVWAKLKNSGVI